ncbi:hypothetical protein CEXT_706651 [Caerostris extrusa]|uniref:Uncharacterized protein n=1 Tax=Caerostris extrusa TaxID=172846 RepID=A0AAV4RNZ8_CAEEX|nr:hypothetical protein CEXT_706651 [Caerostris extrusa]
MTLDTTNKYPKEIEDNKDRLRNRNKSLRPRLSAKIQKKVSTKAQNNLSEECPSRNIRASISAFPFLEEVYPSFSQSAVRKTLSFKPLSVTSARIKGNTTTYEISPDGHICKLFHFENRNLGYSYSPGFQKKES